MSKVQPTELKGLEYLDMAVDLQKIPTTNCLDLRITFLRQGKKVQSLNVGEAQVLDFRFDQIGVGSQEPLSIYDIEIPGSYTIPPGNLAFVDRSVPRKIALRYGPSGGTQQNIIFVLPS
ncbi:hypothetical protein [Microcystis aeruginosa]|jgi:hypothetical protein|uniref:Uncharacterized protein n=2 Tax=Microcystis TaxID=1125 RepID=A0A857CZP4_MICAE|nr:hypothetical protein [Microcystis aeruginosa]MDB9419360.1 hypothetical protein [Microcystis aeruginosa CS-563/04]QGZ88629.1 hypothetical protein GQR42_02345 [Microcystis aeruginosa FD4]TRV07329.1 MAG: hypothetical protein EWV41_12405 [Microcystis wesenbergii Mw_MB_S_20031200_S109]TRV20946.1 MAG: hypothetical protein EWV88_16010 [Microcystis wesenbergii Mw_MB_S_20031200_S109D]